ncbi:EAL domain-containing protein [Acidiferrimicrobium sp. IK]|uniref:putative bifunctional diguanylate cyclase/phosphodiesterase n=1 Tax=Acidiferrimicrobium sp. IK TaxID=2871700 RepID=UPI0021CB72E3|nr:GGDEF domain-containing phosphodiesterase [Acidiferrimicrobium sp. IK]MCU4186729.1 EAL domain-containing protein [Acidiferrimicrobium sp. IK]
MTRFALLCLVLFAALGAGIGYQLHNLVQRRETTAVANDMIVAVRFGAAGFNSLDSSTKSRAATALEAGQAVGAEAVYKDTVLYDSTGHDRGAPVPVTGPYRAALAGNAGYADLRTPSCACTPAARFLLARYHRLVAVYVPISIGRVPMLAMVYMPYAAISSAVAKDTQTIAFTLAIGLTIAYLTLFRLVSRSSRRLHRQMDLNHQLALTDALTGLPNRVNLEDRAARAIADARGGGSRVGLLLLDLDRFKDVNDTLGHHVGDLLLRAIGSRLQDALGDAGTVARLGGDEFAALLTDLASPADAERAARALLAALDAPFEVDDATLDVSGSIGVAVTPDHGTTFVELMQRADIAMYVAKDTQDRVTVFAPDLDTHSRSRLTLLGDLRRAIDDPEQLTLHYQPKADTRSGAIVGVEALARWNHPTEGNIPPDEFIDIAERTGLIKPLTDRVLDMALHQVATWGAAGLDIHVAVNVSPRCLLDHDFPAQVARALAAHAVPVDHLELEITENAVMSEPGRALEILDQLARSGITLSIDDFGTGYSSMAYIRQMPVHQIKIDRVFIAGLADQGPDAAIVRSSIDLARNLGLTVVAEGVETQATWEHLAALGCDTIQGYLLSRPLPPDVLAAWLRQRDQHPPQRPTSALATT